MASQGRIAGSDETAQHRLCALETEAPAVAVVSSPVAAASSGATTAAAAAESATKKRRASKTTPTPADLYAKGM